MSAVASLETYNRRIRNLQKHWQEAFEWRDWFSVEDYHEQIQALVKECVQLHGDVCYEEEE
jgi:hypothetical protein